MLNYDNKIIRKFEDFEKDVIVNNLKISFDMEF